MKCTQTSILPNSSFLSDNLDFHLRNLNLFAFNLYFFSCLSSASPCVCIKKKKIKNTHTHTPTKLLQFVTNTFYQIHDFFLIIWTATYKMSIYFHSILISFVHFSSPFHLLHMLLKYSSISYNFRTISLFLYM